MRRRSRAALSNGPTAEHSWAPQPRWWYLRKNILKRGQNTLNRESGNEKRLRKSRANSKAREGGTSGAPEARSPCSSRGPCWNRWQHYSPWRAPEQNRWIILEGTGPWRCQLEMIFPEGLQHMKASMLEQGKTVSKKVGRWDLLWTDNKPPVTHPPALLVGSREVRNEEALKELGGSLALNQW